MSDEQKRLTEGQIVRCRNSENNLVGVVTLASPNNPQLVMVHFPDDVIRMDGGIVLSGLMVQVDYEAETATDLFGREWEIRETEANDTSAV